MPILGHVESKSIRGRFIHGSIIVALALGSVTMVYPFAIMVSGSFRSDLDENDLDLIPKFWFDDVALYRKFLEEKYNQDISLLNQAHGTTYYSFADVAEPISNDPLADGLEAFIQRGDLPQHWQNLGGIQCHRKMIPRNLRQLRRRLSDHFEGNIAAFGRDVGSPYIGWQAIVFPAPMWTSQRYDYPRNTLYEIYFQMTREADPAEIRLASLTGQFLASMIYPIYGQEHTETYNLAHVQDLANYEQFRLSAKVPPPDYPKLRSEWIEFVRKELNPSFIVVDGATDPQYTAFLHEKFGSKISDLLPDGTKWLSGTQRQAYAEFLRDQPIEQIRLVGPEYHFDANLFPYAMAVMEQRYVQGHRSRLRWHFTLRNYSNIMDELLFQGRALTNTVIFCILALLSALLVNPMAAYGMSRFKLKATYKILLLLMATMSFPPMVTMIPQFILLRQLQLLNTFIALVLPLVANGYMIFLLKGFFDALPQDLYEAARIDGAGEIRMFFQIAMSLSKPILAVLGLGTFNAAYTMFLYPLLVAPDPDMWLISVWLFQYQQDASSAGVYAAVIIASVPTLMVFLFAQRTIMRGIVVPVEK